MTLQINYQRRRIFIGLPLLGTGILSGCVTTGTSGVSVANMLSGKSQPKGYYKSIYYSIFDPAVDSPDAFEGYSRSASSASKMVFETIRDKGVIPGILEMPSLQQLEQAGAFIDEVKNKYSGQKELGIDEALDVAEHVIPFLRMYADLNSPDLKNGTGKNATFSISSDGTMTIPPGYKVVSIQQGYCLDKQLGAPGRGEVLSLFPASTLIPPELRPLYKAMQMKALRDESYRAKMQNLMWTLRSAGQAPSLASQVTPQTLRDMDAALPGGAKAFIEYHNRLLTQSPIPSSPNGGRDWINHPSENSILGLINTLTGRGDQNVKGESADDIFKALVDGMKQGVSGQAPTDDRNYQKIRPGVFTWSLGHDQLKPQIVIVNGSTTNCTFNMSDWIAKPGRPAQHVAMYPTLPQNISYEKLPVTWQDEKSKLDQLKEIGKKIIEGPGHFFTGLYLKNFSQSPEFLNLATRLLRSNPVASNLVKSMPFVGNALCLYEATTGLNWLTGKPINAFERIAATLGVLPLATPLAAALKYETFAKVGGMAFAGAGIATSTGFMNYINDPLGKYATAYKNPGEFATQYTMDALSGGLNSGLLDLVNQNKFSGAQKEDVVDYLMDIRSGYYLKSHPVFPYRNPQ